GVFLDVGAFEEIDEGVTEEDGIAEGFETDGVVGAGDQLSVGDAAEGQDQVVVMEFVGVLAAGGGGVAGENGLGGKIDALNLSLDEADLFEKAAEGIDGVAGFEDAAAGLKEEGGHEEVVFAGDEGDFDALMVFEDFFESPGGVESAKAAAEDEDALNDASWGSDGERGGGFFARGECGGF